LQRVTHKAAWCSPPHLPVHAAACPQRAFDERILGPALRYSASTPLAFLRLVLPQGVSQQPVAELGRIAVSRLSCR